ncbi:hypothetical protein [Cupriavidus pinatubonensis]|uniref:hypothetical protein n=1 Tax=Cupriavidus pinatubonensis TaxID=248026 RepID=UPI001CC7D9FC|nr:hypothetical protein [Cupriavidus pinatubonensis]
MSVRLCAQAWREIKKEYMAGRTAKELAKQFGVTARTIHNRSSQQRWRNEVPVPRAGVASEDLTRHGGAA